MRVSNTTPGMGDIANANGSLGEAAPNALHKAMAEGQKPASAGGIQFGCAAGPLKNTLPQAAQPGVSGDNVVSLLKQLLTALNREQPTAQARQPSGQAGSAQPRSAGSATQPATGKAPANAPTTATPVDETDKTKNGAAVNDQQTAPKAADAEFLDNSKYSSPEELKKYDALVANLPPEQREQAAKELNRPIAAAKMAAEGGPGADQAKAFIDANPALKTALDTGKHGGKPDGNISKNDYAAFAKNMEKAAGAASKDIEQYQKDNPNADPQSLAMVRSAAMLRANEPLAKAGALNQDGKVDKYVTGDALKGLQTGNPGLSPALAQTAKTFSQPGLLHMLDQGGFEGEGLALHNADKKISTKNIDDWIKKQAPTNGGEFASTMSDAATRNAVADVDISKLNEDVFNNPTKYSGAQKAAVMIKLQETQEQVDGGGKLRKVEKTSEALQQKIAQLQADPDVKAYLNKAVPQQEQNIIGGDPALTQAVDQRHADLLSGKSLQGDMKAAEDQAAKDNEGKKPEDQKPVDYSQALGSLDAELQLQGDLKGKDNVPTSAQVLDNRPDLKQKIDRSYQESFVQGKAVESALKQDQKSDAKDVLGQVDAKKQAYDSALGQSVTAAAEDGYAEATMKALTTTTKGVSVLKDLKDAGTLAKDADIQKMTGEQMYSQLRDNVEKQTSAAGLGTGGKLTAAGGGAFGVAGLLSLSDQLKNGDKAGAAKTIYDGAKGSAELAKLGYNAVAKDASAGLGRIAGSVAGRVAGMVAGEAAGLAAAEAVGAAAGPVGWAIDAAMAIGFGIKAIIDAVNKHKKQEKFDHNVDPTLEQFGIPKAH
ncbi:type III effector HrpK domain-containing protein [Pseudomonas typographi]|uniref:type III effector HrpK domain-containing protein n=1 Tax=Pseudomonas typographi TaxID=2715964 RepID=UPI00168549AC|nr:type III effector HrpK domain-containing protein [Pseudomonas typographi]MBD1554543.1 type III effector HrpK [Pseudomonas typographi]